MRAEFCIFESNAPGLKANFYEPYVDKPTLRPFVCYVSVSVYLYTVQPSWSHADPNTFVNYSALSLLVYFELPSTLFLYQSVSRHPVFNLRSIMLGQNSFSACKKTDTRLGWSNLKICGVQQQSLSSKLTLLLCRWKWKKLIGEFVVFKQIIFIEYGVLRTQVSTRKAIFDRLLQTFSLLLNTHSKKTQVSASKRRIQ